MINLTKEELYELIKEREGYSYFPFTDITDSLLEKKLSNSELRNFWYIGRDDEIDRFYKKNPDTEWKISGIYQFDYFYDVIRYFDQNKQSFNYYNHFNERYFLFHFSKNNFKKVEIGFDYLMQEKRLDYYLKKINFWEMHEIPEKSVPDYIKTKDYSVLEAFPIFVGKSDISLETFDVKTIPQKNFFNNYICLIYRYDKSVVDFYGLPTEKEICKPLGDFVDIVDYSSIQYGDLYAYGYYLEKEGFNPFIRMIDDADDQLFAIECYCEERGDTIIRCHDDKIRKYLYLYLYERNTFLEKLYKRNYLDQFTEFKEIPVFIPSENLRNFDSFFDDLIAKRKKQYFDANKKYKLENKKTKYESTVQLIDKYMDEFEKCINSEAYTAALIMAGSVLEAFLIDWIANEPDIIDSDNLEDCINKLQDKYGFKNPPWDAEKAHFIRKRRNLVHPKKLLKANEEINKDMCDEAYIYLNYIIDYRNNFGENGKHEEG